MNVHSLVVFTATTFSGQLFYLFLLGRRSLWVSADIALGPPAKLRQHLAAGGLVLSERDAVAGLLKKVADASPYTGPAPIDGPGWNGQVYGWPDGSVSVPPHVEKSVATYRAQFNYFPRRGTMRGWRLYADPLGNQPLAAFLFALPLAAVIRPLLRPSDDLIFELVMPLRAEIDLPGLLIGSITGGVTVDHVHHAQFHSAVWTPVRGDPYNDPLLVLRDPEIIMAGASASARTNHVRARISHGIRSVDHPWLRPCTTLLLGRERFASLAGGDTDIGRLAKDRINTIEVAPERQFGLLDRVPAPFGSITEYILHLRGAVGHHHGALLHRFVDRAVQELARDESGLVNEIRRRIEQFRTNTKCDLSDANAVRVADDFGLLYAAGRLAQLWGYFAKEWNVGPRLMTCYQDFHTPRAPMMSFDEELQGLLFAPDALHIGLNQPKPDDDALADAEVIVKHLSTHVELIIRPSAIEGRIRNWKQRVNDPQVVARAHREKGKVDKTGPQTMAPDNRRDAPRLLLHRAARLAQ